MDIYVQSAGHKPEQDYHWYQLTEQGLTRAEPNFISHAREWMDIEAPSVVLIKEKGEVHLLVTNLPTKDRTDYRGRKLRNYVAWSGGETDEDLLCTVAANFVESFEPEADKIDKLILSTSENNAGFSVSGLNEYTYGTKFKNKDKYATERAQIAQSTQANKKKLADVVLRELKIPHKNAVIVVTDVFDPKKWKTNCPNLWRGLTNLKDSEGWSYFGENKDERPLVETLNEFKKNFTDVIKRKPSISSSLKSLIILSFLAVLLGFYNINQYKDISSLQHELTELKNNHEMAIKEKDNDLSESKKRLKEISNKNKNLRKKITALEEKLNSNNGNIEEERLETSLQNNN